MTLRRRLFARTNALLPGRRSLAGADVLVSGSRIERIAPADTIPSAEADETIDLDGAVLLPGFVDGHCHLELTVTGRDHHVAVHTPPYTSLTQILEHLARARRVRPKGWLIARSSFGLQHKVHEARLPHRDELDLISPNEPLAVLAGLHVACLNTRAMSILGLSDPTALPSWIDIDIDLDAAGPTGAFTEVWDRLPTHSTSEVMQSLRRHSRSLISSLGTTSLSTISTSAEDVRALHRLARLGELPFRVRFFVHVPRTASLSEVLSWGPESGFGDDMLRFGGVKIFVDGEGATAYGKPKDDTKWNPAELERFVEAADEAGIQVLMHAVTPRAIRLACEVVRSIASRRTLAVRHRIEHGADYVDADAIPFVAGTPVGLVATPHFVESAGSDAYDFQPLRALIDAGVDVVGASDATGTVPDGVSPMRAIGLAAGRRTAAGAPSPHRISVREGLSMFGEWAAQGVNEDHEKGSIEVGKLADFIIAGRDPLTADPEELAEIAVLSTFVAGERMTGAAR
ncbi:amidohydrolase [Streptomyces sp. NPDC001520]|uniref:amidohydrolase n=1 Tax=Streptomyces sp. NPDC001520 TaxID=3364581 RepID=UPI003690A12A